MFILICAVLICVLVTAHQSHALRHGDRQQVVFLFPRPIADVLLCERIHYSLHLRCPFLPFNQPLRGAAINHPMGRCDMTLSTEAALRDEFVVVVATPREGVSSHRYRGKMIFVSCVQFVHRVPEPVHSMGHALYYRTIVQCSIVYHVS